MLKLTKTFLLCTLAAIICACTEDRVFEQNYDLPNNVWPIAEKVNFEFDIENAKPYYQIFLNIRHNADYPYRNIYINYQLRDTTEFIMENALANVSLFSNIEGKPYGKATSNVFSYQELLLDSMRFPHQGDYIFSMYQYMRVDSLDGVYSVGIKIVEQPIAVE
ncbi:MAG: gliding motility-associated lipoprotein GldH [Marivirga sp.]|jgi:gliding motility-associated lipoprotein GldH